MCFAFQSKHGDLPTSQGPYYEINAGGACVELRRLFPPHLRDCYRIAAVKLLGWDICSFFWEACCPSFGSYCGPSAWSELLLWMLSISGSLCVCVCDLSLSLHKCVCFLCVFSSPAKQFSSSKWTPPGCPADLIRSSHCPPGHSTEPTGHGLSP